MQHKITRLTGLAGLAAIVATGGWAEGAIADTAGTQQLTTVGAPQYAIQAVSAAGGTLSDPETVSFTAAGYTTTAARTFDVTFTLPTGVTFTGANPACVGTANFTVAYVSGGSGFQSITCSVSVPVVANATDSVSIAGFNIAGATALQTVTPSGKFKFTANISNSAAGSAFANGAVAAGGTTDVATSADGLIFTAGNGLGFGFVDVTAAGLGQKFLQPATSTTDTTVFDVGTVNLQANPATVQANGTTPFSFGSSTAKVTLTGNFNGIGTAYLTAAGTTTCSTTASGQQVTPTSGAVTFTGVAVTAAGTSQEICLLASGKGVIAAPPNFALSTSIGSTTDSPQAGGISSYFYNGSVAVIQLSPNLSGYNYAVRVTNNSGSDGQPIAVVQTDTGTGALSTPPLTTVKANNNTFYSVPSLFTAAGATVPAGSAASITMLGPNGFGFSQIEVNPGGVVVNIQ
ncbi:MAG TPA: hypothetical protein VFA12_11400 [Stellaceae bacterium]|nr:hypothetical protein [Stellaceae bacterium]